MSKNKLIFAAILAIVLMIGGTIFILEWFAPRRTIVLEVLGPPGSALTGEVEIDGKLHAINEKLPAKLSYEARRVGFALIATKDGVRQELSANILVEGQLQMSVSGGKGARGEIFKPTVPGLWWRQQMWITSQSEGKIQE
ncbi:MAG: hypothetical protein L0Y71_08355 [Gemmataceae bacterium]|nr:hypothetical protein [Gemmataceae bacterium]